MAVQRTMTSTGNRIFNDEIAAVSSLKGWIGVDVEVTEPGVQHGPRERA